jgi:hypothetical protein
VKSASPERTPPADESAPGDEGTPARRSWKRRLLIFGLPLLVVIAAAAWGINYYLTSVPEQLADDYHEQAAPEFERVDESMDRVFDSFHRYVARSTISFDKLRGIDNDEARDLLMPLYKKRDTDLKAAEKAIAEVRKRIKRAKPVLADTPSQTFLDDKDPMVATRQAKQAARDYFDRATRYLDSYSLFIRSEGRFTNLLRRRIVVLADQPDTRGLPAAEVIAVLNGTVDELEQIDADARQLDPHRDTTRIYREFRDGLNDYILYLEDVVTSWKTLDPGLYREANDRRREDFKNAERQEGNAYDEFRLDSGLANATRDLGPRADDVAEAISDTDFE